MFGLFDGMNRGTCCERDEVAGFGGGVRGLRSLLAIDILAPDLLCGCGSELLWLAVLSGGKSCCNW